jgi:hypothetical protein
MKNKVLEFPTRSSLVGLAAQVSLTLVLILPMSLMSGCNLFATGTADASSNIESASSLSNDVLLNDKVIVLVLDPSGSTREDYSATVLSEFSKAVAASVPSKPNDFNQDTPALPAQKIIVYMVGANPNSYGAAIYLIREIPGVSALEAKPKAYLSEDEVTEEDLVVSRQWHEDEQAWSAAYDNALAATQSVAAEIAAISLEVTDVDANGAASGILNTTSAALSVCPQEQVSLLVASDLFESSEFKGVVPQGMSGCLTLIVPSPDGDAAAAEARAQAFSETLQSWGFEPANVYKPELTTDAIYRALNS